MSDDKRPYPSQWMAAWMAANAKGRCILPAGWRAPSQGLTINSVTAPSMRHAQHGRYDEMRCFGWDPNDLWKANARLQRERDHATEWAVAAMERCASLTNDFESLEWDAAAVVRAFHRWDDDPWVSTINKLVSACEELRDKGRPNWWEVDQ